MVIQLKEWEIRKEIIIKTRFKKETIDADSFVASEFQVEKVAFY